MNNLYFVKYRNRKDWDRIVFMFTAKDNEEAIAKGFAMISDSCRADYDLDAVDFVCTTPDTIDCFEPV